MLMKILVFVFVPLLMLAAHEPAQGQASAQESVQNLRSQLQEVQAQEAELQSRVRQLETDMDPLNIEHSLAGVGSTHPEELRAQRRRQLELEKTKLQDQLNQLASSRARLESAIASAEAAAYRQSATLPDASQPPQTAQPLNVNTNNASNASAAPFKAEPGTSRRRKHVRRRRTRKAPARRG